MINSVSSNTPPPPPPRSSNSDDSLTDEQSTLLSDTLSEYDPDNLTTSDAETIMESLYEAGISPGQGLESAMSELGFDAKAIGDLGHQSGGDMPPPPPPPQQSSEEITSMADYLTELLEEKLEEEGLAAADELSDTDKQSIMSALAEKFGIDEDDTIINTTV